MINSESPPVARVEDMANKNITCNQCGAEFELTLRHRADGDLDITYIQCPFCNEEYLVSVTDSVLRDAISEHRKLADSIKTAADAETSMKLAESARQMYESNNLRCFELMAKYSAKNAKA